MGEAGALPGEVAVNIHSGDVTLAGTYVDVPDQRATAVILSGSGKLDRDSNTSKLKIRMSETIAQVVADHGVASLRFDKRGVGESGGSFLSTGMTENYADAQAALAWLSSRCPGVPIFVIGHSEGSLHAAHLAADGRVDGAVLIASPARTGEEILTWQAREVTKTLPKVTRSILRVLHIDPLKMQQKQFVRFRSSTADVMRVQGRTMNARWFRQFLDYDPVPILDRISVPVLTLIGGHDIQVPPEDAAKIASFVKGQCEAHVVGDLSHLLRSDPETKGLKSYRRSLREPVDPTCLGMIAGWIDRRVLA